MKKKNEQPKEKENEHKFEGPEKPKEEKLQGTMEQKQEVHEKPMEQKLEGSNKPMEQEVSEKAMEQKLAGSEKSKEQISEVPEKLKPVDPPLTQQTESKRVEQQPLKTDGKEICTQSSSNRLVEPITNQLGFCSACFTGDYPLDIEDMAYEWGLDI